MQPRDCSLAIDLTETREPFASSFGDPTSVASAVTVSLADDRIDNFEGAADPAADPSGASAGFCSSPLFCSATSSFSASSFESPSTSFVSVPFSVVTGRQFNRTILA